MYDNCIFVATDGSNSGGDGSIESPFQTLDHAQKVVRPGQTVFFRGGHYLIELTDLGVIHSKGKPDAWITFQNYEGEHVVFDGGGRSMLISTYPSLITLYMAEYVILDGFEVCNLWGQGITNFDTLHTVVRNCTIHDFHSRGLGGHGRFNAYENNEVFHTCMANADGTRRAGGGWAAALATINRPYFAPSTDIIIRGNRVYENFGEGIDAFLAADVVICDNEVRDNFSVNIYSDTSRNVTIERNRVSTRNPRYFRDNMPAVGVQISNEGTKTTRRLTPNTCAEHIYIRDNVLSGVADGVAYWEDSNNTWETNTYHDIRIENNLFADNWLYTVAINKVSVPGVSAPSACVMAGNTFHKTRNGQYHILGDPQAWIVRANRFEEAMAEEPTALEE